MFTISFDALTKNEKIGEGGFGIVYKGTYQFAPAAIKQLQIDNLSSDAEEEFNKEAAIMAQLHHPNVVHFYGYCTVPKCLVMEYMPKGSLFTVLHNKKESLDWNIRMRIATDMVSGLAFLHSRNILHRDIKSLNVLLDGHSNAKLTDFGLSQVKNETKSKTSATKTHQDTVGTVQWMAPELFKRRAVFTQKADIYSLGITFWELAARKIPYARDTQAAIPTFVQQGEREDIPQDCPEKLAHLIQQCWANDPNARPSALEIARFMTTDAKTLQEVQAPLKSPALESTGYQLTSQLAQSFTPYQDNLNSNPELSGFKNLEITPPSSNTSLASPQRRGSNILNLADKKEEQEKTRYVLEQLRTFFLEDREEGERSENYDIYNEHLKKASKDNAYLVYKPKQNKHILYLNDEPVDNEVAAKALSKMLKSLTLAGTPVAQNANPAQAASPILPAAKVNPPEQKNGSGPAMLLQFPGIVKPAPAPTPRPLNASELKELQEFLKAVAEGEQDKAEAMLKQNPALALTPTDVTDLSKRTFKNITALQYALWALDWHMWTMLLKYIPQKEASEQIAQIAQSEQGLWIPQHGVTANWENLIQALNQYVSEVRSKKPYHVYSQTWIKQVGGAQLLLPAHVINEYCHPTRPFDPVPDFSKLEATGAWRTRATDEGEWFSANYGVGTLGEGFAVCRGINSRARRVFDTQYLGGCAERDSAAVAALLKTRASQRAAVVAPYLPKQEPARKIAKA